MPAETLAACPEVTGRVVTVGFAPMLVATVVRFCGTAPLSEPRRVDATSFFQGVYGSTLVEVEGVVQTAIPYSGTWRVTMAAFGRPFTVDVVRFFFDGDPRDLVDAEVRVRGPTIALFNTRGEFLMPWITVNQPGGFTVVSPPPQPPFESPTVPLGRLAGFRTAADRGHMVRIEGTVIHAVPGEGVFLVEGDRGVRVLTAAIEGFVPGDRVVAAGFIDRSGPIARLAHALVRRMASGPSPTRSSSPWSWATAAPASSIPMRLLRR